MATATTIVENQSRRQLYHYMIITCNVICVCFWLLLAILWFVWQLITLPNKVRSPP
jgi:hypothetical protein